MRIIIVILITKWKSEEKLSLLQSGSQASFEGKNITSRVSVTATDIFAIYSQASWEQWFKPTGKSAAVRLAGCCYCCRYVIIVELQLHTHYTTVQFEAAWLPASYGATGWATPRRTDTRYPKHRKGICTYVIIFHVHKPDHISSKG